MLRDNLKVYFVYILYPLSCRGAQEPMFFPPSWFNRNYTYLYIEGPGVAGDAVAAVSFAVPLFFHRGVLPGCFTPRMMFHRFSDRHA